MLPLPFGVARLWLKNTHLPFGEIEKAADEGGD
jgi:hypothetical protein